MADLFEIVGSSYDNLYCLVAIWIAGYFWCKCIKFLHGAEHPRFVYWLSWAPYIVPIIAIIWKLVFM
uniref:Receptor expression-enhancing protein n=1 Tax=Steinernema glaseri TaxID=37863 RepID=A0A1I7YI20_9BILA